MMESLPLWSALVGAPIVSGVVQAIKRAGVPGEFLPLASIVVGVLLGVVAAFATDTSLLVVAGLVAGIGAPGVYETVKKAPALMGSKPNVNP